MSRRFKSLMVVLVLASAAAYLYIRPTSHDLSAIHRKVPTTTVSTRKHSETAKTSATPVQVPTTTVSTRKRPETAKTSATPVQDRTRWMQPIDETVSTAVSLLKTLTEQGQRHKLDLFVLGPDLLSAMADNQLTGLLDVWDRSSGAHSSVLTFGVIEPDMGNLNQMAEALDGQAFLRHHVVTGVDLRGVTVDTFLNNQTLHSVPFHYVWWSRGSAAPTPLIHVVIFRPRGGNLWHGQLLPPKAEALPFKVSDLVVGQDSRMVDRFTIHTAIVHGIRLWFPSNITAFLRAYQDGVFLECDYLTAMKLAKGDKKVRSLVRPSEEFNKKAVGLLASTKKTLDELGIRFWISNGILLGWFRQCGVVSYTGDLDIQLSIRDYSEALITAMVKSGHRRVSRSGKVSEGLLLKFTRGGINVDMYFIYEEKDHVWLGTLGDNYEKFRMKYPKFSLRLAELLGLIVRVPDRPELLLKTEYGDGWRTPNSSYHWLLSPCNKVLAGQWTDAERKLVHEIY